MKRILALLFTIIFVSVLFACTDGGKEAPSTDSSSWEAFAHESEQGGPSSDESSDLSCGEESENTIIYDETTEKPEIFGCTRVENGIFVVLGTCEQGAVITVDDGEGIYSSKSDHGYFSVRIPRRGTGIKLMITAETDGKNKSDVLEYTARPKSVGSDQWELIAAADYQFHIKYTLNDYLRNNAYDESTLKGLTNKLATRVESLKTSLPDTEIIYMIVPSPASTYPEGMPDSYKVIDGPSRLEQVITAIGNAGIKVIDLRDAFAEHKNDDYKLYWKTDSHWTDYGAYIAYKELFDYISLKHPECSPRAFDEFEWVEDVYVGGDIAYYLEYYGNNGYTLDNTPMREYNVLRKPAFDMPTAISSIKRYTSERQLTYNKSTVQNACNIDTKRSELPSAVIMRDSYSTQIFDILAERFNKTWYKGMWDFGYNISEIKQKKPDYIIYIAVERNIDSLFK